MRSALVVLVALVGVACYAPHYPEGLTCATGSEPCPPGQTCGADNVCRATPSDAMPPGDGLGAPDAQLSWILEPSGTTGDLHGVWGQTAGDVFAVGKASAATGLVVHRGSTGTWMEMDFGMPLAAISGATGNIWAVGAQGQAYQLVSGGWVLHTTGNASFGAVVRGSTGPVIGAAVGSNEAFYVDTGSGFQPKTLNLTPAPTLAAVTLDAGNRLWAVGDQTLIKFDTGVATKLPSPVSAPDKLRSVWGDNTNLFIGSDSSLVVYDDVAIGMRAIADVPGCAGLDGDGRAGVWCASAHGIYRGTITGAFVLDFAPLGVTFTAIHVVGSEVYAVGLGGVIWRRTTLD